MSESGESKGRRMRELAREGEVPFLSTYGTGTYRRRIELVSDEPGVVRGELEDDFHHFGVTLRHAEGRVVEMLGDDIRVPWTTCPGAMTALDAWAGQPLDISLLDLARAVDARLQCTHAFDLACLAIALAAREREGGASRRNYDIALPDRVGGSTEPTLLRNGELLLRWKVEGITVSESEPPFFVGRKLMGSGFNLMVARELHPELGEAALVFRRAIFIGLGRQYDFERIEHARDFGRVVGSACHTFHPDRVEQATRVHGSRLDFSEAERAASGDGSS